MTEVELKHEARIIALEYMWAHTYNVIMKMIGVTENTITQAELDAAKTISLNPVAGLDPAMSDMMSAEIGESIDRLWVIAREMREAGRT